MYLGTFSRRARSLATTCIFARVRIIGTLVPFCVDGTIQEGDVVIFINYRNDRAKELTQEIGRASCRERV